MPSPTSISSSTQNSSFIANTSVDNLKNSACTTKKHHYQTPKTVGKSNTVSNELKEAKTKGVEAVQAYLQNNLRTNLCTREHAASIFRASGTENSVETRNLFGPITNAAKRVAEQTKARLQNAQQSAEASTSKQPLNHNAEIDSTDCSNAELKSAKDKDLLAAEESSAIGKIDSVLSAISESEGEVDNSICKPSDFPPPDYGKLNTDEELHNNNEDNTSLVAVSNNNTDVTTETLHSEESIQTHDNGTDLQEGSTEIHNESIQTHDNGTDLQEGSTEIQNESIGTQTQATAKKQVSYGAENTEHSHRGSDQKALLISSLVTLAIGAIGLTVGLVEKGESSSDTDSIDQLDEMEANLGEQIETLENNAAQEQQLSETIDKFVTDCDGDAAKLTELATTLEDNKTEILDAAGAQVYEAALTEATNEAFKDPNNQAMGVDDNGNLVPTGELTQAAQAECAQQATDAQQAASEKMSIALDSAISSIDEKAGDISKLSAQAAIASDNLKTLSTSDLATAESLKNQIQSAELLETNMTNVTSGLSQAGFVGLMATSSISLAASIPLLTKYAINHRHNSKANDEAAIKEAAPLTPDEFANLKKAMATPKPATPENIDLANRFAAGAA